MNIFNSLGSNYNFVFVLKSLFNFSQSDPQLKKFLEEKYVGKAFLVYKGREAIELGLKILNLPKDSFVAINGFTCFAVYEAIKNAGLNVEYLDLEKGDLNFSAEELKKRWSQNPKIKVVIVQNTLGYPSNIGEISKICKEKSMTLIEDLAHCVGTKYSDDIEAGMVGDMVVLSFSQDKIIDGISGGALIVKNPQISINEQFTNLGFSIQLKDRFYPFFTFLIRNTYTLFGLGKLFHAVFKKINLLPKPVESITPQVLHKLPGFYCKLINSAFEELRENLNHRKTIASIYSQSINPKVMSPTLKDQINNSSNLRFPIFVNNRGDLIKYLKSHGIYISDTWYDAPIAPKKYLSLTDYKHSCPNSEDATSVILNLPTHRMVSTKDAINISQLINQWLKSQ